MAKSMILLLDANHHGKLVSAKIEDGSVIIKNKQFFVDQSNPIWLEKGLTQKPLYIIKWSSVQPSTNLNPIKSDGIVQYVTPGPIPTEKARPQFRDRYEITPELFRKISGMKILGNMIPIKKQRSFGPVLLMVALVAMVAVAAFALTMVFHIKLW